MDQLGDVQQQEYQIFTEQVSGHSIMLKLQNSGLIAKSTSDKNINEQIFYKWIANKHNYDSFIPKYYGEITLQVDHLNTSLADNSKQQQWLAELFKKRFNSNHKKYIILQDLTCSFECPRIIDIKLGFKSNKPTKIPKYVNSTSSQLGFRINGMKIQRSQSNQDFFDKYWGRNLDQQELIQGLQLYFMHDNKQEILQQVQIRLSMLVEFIENECQQVRSWDSCSILIVYGDKETMVNLIDFQNVFIDAEYCGSEESAIDTEESMKCDILFIQKLLYKYILSNVKSFDTKLFLNNMQGGQQVIVLNTNTKREQGRKTQLTNIQAAKAVSDIVLTTLGPRSMLKMLLDPMGGIVMTNDGNAILREIDVQHPAAKSMIELARAQDEEVGDGTTSVIILAGEMLVAARPFIEKNIHPTEIVGGYFKALEEAQQILDEIAQNIDVEKHDQVMRALQSCIGTKFAFRWGSLISDLALKATKAVMKGGNLNKLNLEIKRYAKVEKIPGGTLEDCCVLDGVMINKDVTHPGMRRSIKNPRIILLDSTLEYKKGESMTNMEMTKDSDMVDALQQEVNEVALMCNDILKWKPDIVITEKGISDTAQHFLMKGNVSMIRRVRKTDNNRLARISGATIASRPEELQESDIGTLVGQFDVKKIGDDYFAFFVECKEPSACSIILRGASKDVLNEMERNLHDCLAVAKNIYCEPKLLPGGGAVEMEVSARLLERATKIEGLGQLPFKAVAYALEVIPRTLAANCGGDVVRILTELRAKHSEKGGLFYGVDGNTGKIADMQEINVWEPLAVKKQVIKTAIESACMLLRIDDLVSGIKKKEKKTQGAEQGGENETFGDARDG